MDKKETCSGVQEVAHHSSQLYLHEIGAELANLFNNDNQDKPEKMAATLTALGTLSPEVIGLIIGGVIEFKIREDLRVRGRCLQCGERKDLSGKCPKCSG